MSILVKPMLIFSSINPKNGSMIKIPLLKLVIFLAMIIGTGELIQLSFMIQLLILQAHTQPWFVQAKWIPMLSYVLNLEVLVCSHVWLALLITSVVPAMRLELIRIIITKVAILNAPMVLTQLATLIFVKHVIKLV